MRKILLFTAVLLMVLAGCDRQRTVEFPVSDTVIEWMSVYKVSLSDTATVVEGNFYGWPGDEIRIPASEFRLRGASDGAEYKLCGTPAAADTVYARIPDNWTVPFSLVFEPLKEEETSFDLLCRNDAVKGIATKERKSRYVTVIEGILVDRPNTSRIILNPYDSDPRVNPFISIPVEDGKFRYELKSDVRTVYELLCWDDYCHGAWYSQNIFSDNGKVSLTVRPQSFDSTVREITVDETTTVLNGKYLESGDVIYTGSNGTDLRALQYRLIAELDSLYDNDLYFNEEYMALEDSVETFGYTDDLMNRLFKMSFSGEGLSEAGHANRDRQADLYSEIQENTIRYCEENTDEVGYFLMVDNYLRLEYIPYPTDSVRTAYRNLFEAVYAKEYADHPFTEKMYHAIAAEDIRPGGHYTDFSAPDLSGKMHTLSDEISGKVAVIDLWASWCGPCRRHSMALIPIYEEYKDKGFTVVGVARENNNTDAMKAALEKDGYPWLNLVELNDAGRIWPKYGAGNGGGRIILVAADGTIVAVDPTDEEILSYLQRTL